MPAEGLLAGLALVAAAPALLDRIRSAADLAPAGSASALAADGHGGHRTAGSRSAARGEARRRRRNRRRAVGGAVVAACVAGGGLWYFDSVPGTGRQEPAAARGAGAAVPDELVEPSPVSTSASPSASASTSPKPSAKPSKKTTPSPSAKKTEKATPTGQAPTRASRKAASAPQQEAPSGTVGQVVALVNKERAAAGCGPLAEDSLLDKSAQTHSADMAARDFFDHTNPDGADPGQRITAAGYRWSTYGENIAMGQQTPEAVMESWMNSPGHRANILNCSFKDIGVGVHEGPGGPWWTQNFGAKL